MTYGWMGRSRLPGRLLATLGANADYALPDNARRWYRDAQEAGCCS